MSDNEPRTCPRCGIFYYEWLLDRESARALFREQTETVPEAMVPNMHECPEPYPYETARMMAATLAASGMPVSQTTKARIKLGLEQGA
jgi:hypothetical protein